jgi:hypothetical protein
MWRMEVGMSKKKDIHILKIFAELSQLSVGDCIHKMSATPTAEQVSQNRDGVGVGFLKQG